MTLVNQIQSKAIDYESTSTMASSSCPATTVYSEEEASLIPDHSFGATRPSHDRPVPSTSEAEANGQTLANFRDSPLSPIPDHAFGPPLAKISRSPDFDNHLWASEQQASPMYPTEPYRLASKTFNATAEGNRLLERPNAPYPPLLPPYFSGSRRTRDTLSQTRRPNPLQYGSSTYGSNPLCRYYNSLYDDIPDAAAIRYYQEKIRQIEERTHLVTMQLQEELLAAHTLKRGAREMIKKLKDVLQETLAWMESDES